VGEIALETKRIADLAKGYDPIRRSLHHAFPSSPRRGQNAFRTGKREMINASQRI